MTNSRTNVLDRITDLPSVPEHGAIARDFTEPIDLEIPRLPDRIQVQEMPRVGAEDADHIGTGQEAQALGWEVGAAGAERRKLPADRGEIVEHALTQEDLSLACCSLVAQHRPLAAEGQVLRPVWVVLQGAADEPDALAAPELGNDDPSGEMLAQRSCAVGNESDAALLLEARMDLRRGREVDEWRRCATL
jgi:hypothetical protein